MGSLGSNDESRILITGAAGFIGQGLAAALSASDPSIHLVLTDMVAPTAPANTKATSVKSDLTDPSSIASLLQPHRYRAVYLLHGLMSGGAEANLELGWRVNWDSHRAIIDFLRLHHPGTTVVFPSSLAVYGPSHAGEVTSEATIPLPQSSYGAQKLMVETYLGDMTRRGLLDGRVVRLPTIIVRPGAPSAAASSFASGIVREPLRGEESVLPVSPSLDMWVCSPSTVIRNLVLVKDVPGHKLGKNIVMNLPGITVTVQDILDALESVGGARAAALVRHQRDPKVEAIVGSWPARFDIRKAESMGMVADGSLEETVKQFAELHVTS